jgi:hypothetical protein
MQTGRCVNSGERTHGIWLGAMWLQQLEKSSWMTYELFDSVHARPRETLNVKDISLTSLRKRSPRCGFVYGVHMASFCKWSPRCGWSSYSLVLQMVPKMWVRVWSSYGFVLQMVPKMWVEFIWLSFANGPQDVVSFIEFISGSTCVFHSLPLFCMWVVGWVTKEPKEVTTDECQINSWNYLAQIGIS